MKALNHLKQKALLLLLLVAAGMAKAQSHEFAPVGAEWYYSRLYREGWNYTGVAYDRYRSLRTIEIITDMTGKTIYEQETTDDALSINLSNTPNGIYLVQITKGSQKMNKQIVKR